MAGAAITLTRDNFEEVVLQSERPVLVDFFTPWCRHCVEISPLIDALAEEQARRFTVGKLNVDDEQEIAERYPIEGIPTFLVFKGGKQVAKIDGTARREQFIAALENAL